jgi:hypothetical protein
VPLGGVQPRRFAILPTRLRWLTVSHPLVWRRCAQRQSSCRRAPITVRGRQRLLAGLEVTTPAAGRRVLKPPGFGSQANEYLREEHDERGAAAAEQGVQDEAAEASAAARNEDESAKPEDFENDPARNPDDDTLKNMKGG